MIPKEAVIEYQQIYQRVFGIGISFDEAVQQGTKLLRLFQLIYYPMPKNWSPQGQSKLLDNPRRRCINKAKILPIDKLEANSANVVDTSQT